MGFISILLESVDELSPKKDERRGGVERRKMHSNYEGPERRSGVDRRAGK
jgi:hypothetical protein